MNETQPVLHAGLMNTSECGSRQSGTLRIDRFLGPTSEFVARRPHYGFPAAAAVKRSLLANVIFASAG